MKERIILMLFPPASSHEPSGPAATGSVVTGALGSRAGGAVATGASAVERTMKTLDQLAVGRPAIIRAVALAGDEALLRLREMGMTPEAAVRVTRRGLGGDPLEVQVRGTRLCLRRRHAACFEVAEDHIPAAEPHPR